MVVLVSATLCAGDLLLLLLLLRLELTMCMFMATSPTSSLTTSPSSATMATAKAPLKVGATARSYGSWCDRQAPTTVLLGVSATRPSEPTKTPGIGSSLVRAPKSPTRMLRHRVRHLRVFVSVTF